MAEPQERPVPQLEREEGQQEETSPPEAAGVADERFAANIREGRERLKMSQGELARRMAARGFPYYQQTVRRIEDGRRRVSVGEAKALAEILGTTMDRLTWPTTAASAASLLDATIASAVNAHGAITEYTSDLLWTQRRLTVTIGEMEQAGYHGSDKVREIADEARVVLEMTPERAVDYGRNKYERLVQTGENLMGNDDERG